jgi:hypothetical protein
MPPRRSCLPQGEIREGARRKAVFGCGRHRDQGGEHGKQQAVEFPIRHRFNRRRLTAGFWQKPLRNP